MHYKYGNFEFSIKRVFVQEREAQVEILKRKREYEKIIEHKHLEIERENIKIQEQRELERIIQEEQKKKEAQVVLRQQHEEFKLKYIKRMQEEKIEGEIIKQKAVEAAEKVKEDELKRKIRLKELQQEIFKGNEVLQVEIDFLYFR